jgi:hypothetical protein
VAKDREAIYSALVDLIREAMPGTRITRREYPIDQCPEYPCIMVLEGDETVQHQGRGIPPTWTLNATVMYVARANGTEEDAPGAPLHDFLDAFEAGLSPARGPQTLGGLCDWCYISGEIAKAPPTSDDPIMVAIIPVEMRAV